MKNLKILTVLLIALGSIIGATSCGNSETGDTTTTTAPAAPAAAATVPVRVTALSQRTFTDFLRVKGSLEAKNKATISSRVTGTILEVKADIGDQVKAGQVLFTIDPRTYQDGVEVAAATVKAQQAAVKVAEANVVKAQAELHKATLDQQRFQRLFDKKQVSSNELEQYQLAFEQAKSGLAYAEASLESQKAQVALAEATLAIKQKDLEDTVIKAPFDGAIASRLHDPGEEIDGHTAVFTLVDTRVLRATAALPAAYYNSIVTGKTTLELAVDGKVYPHKVLITEKSPVVETGLRTFTIKAQIQNDHPKNPLVPGVLTDMAVALKQSTGFALPDLVPIRRESGTLIFTVVDGKAKAIAVSLGLEEDGLVEIHADQLTQGMPIITDGQYLVQDNTPVAVANPITE